MNRTPRGMSAASVDVIIPVHDATRPVARAIESLVLDECVSRVTVTVVCHNVAVSSIHDALGDVLDDRVRLVEHVDRLSSPAGPRNHGFMMSAADYVCFVDSDDFLERGAIDAWVAMARRHDLDVVIARERHANGRVVRTQPTRPFRTLGLDPVRDRLSYRTAVRGLIRRRAMQDHHIRYSERHATGEDQIVTTKLFFSGLNVGFARRSPSYVIGDDARSRVTLTARDLGDELAAVEGLLTDPFVTDLDLQCRRAIVSRVVRVQLFAAVSARARSIGLSRHDRDQLRDLIARCDRVGSDWEKSFSRADRDLLDALRTVESSESTIADLAARRRMFARPRAVLTRDLSRVLSREAPLRVITASAMV